MGAFPSLRKRAQAVKEPWVLDRPHGSLLVLQESVTFAVTQFLLLSSTNNHTCTFYKLVKIK